MAKCRIDDAWRIGFCWCPARAESSLLYNIYSFQKFHEQMRTIPGVTTRLFEEPIECSRTLPVMRSIPKRKVVRKYDRVSQYTNEPPTLGYILQQNRRAKRNPMLMGDGRMEWNVHVSVTVRVYHSSMSVTELLWMFQCQAARSEIRPCQHLSLLLCKSAFL